MPNAGTSHEELCRRPCIPAKAIPVTGLKRVTPVSQTASSPHPSLVIAWFCWLMTRCRVQTAKRCSKRNSVHQALNIMFLRYSHLAAVRPILSHFIFNFLVYSPAGGLIQQYWLPRMEPEQQTVFTYTTATPEFTWLSLSVRQDRF
jgi:hypothetical protein